MAGYLEPEGQILTGFVANDGTPIGGAQVEGGDDAALGAHCIDSDCAPARPAAVGRSVVLIEPLLARDQDMGQDLIGFAPGSENLFGGGIPITTLIAPSSASLTGG